MMKIPKEIKNKHGTNNIKDKHCSVINCDKKAKENVSQKDYDTYMDYHKLKYVRNRNKRIYLCKEHFSKISKSKQKDKKIRKGLPNNDPKPYKMSW